MKTEEINERVIPILEKAIPNLYEYFDKKEIRATFETLELSDNDNVTEVFMTEIWEMPIRRCSACGKLMREGYCESGGYAYYCSDDCLHTKFSDAEWAQECENDEQSYYTEWE